MKIMILQIRANIFVLNFAYLFRRQLCKSVLLCAVFN